MPKQHIPRPFIDDVITRTDIVELIDARVHLKKAGRNYAACCPFHEEKTPSFTVSPQKQFYHCFGCGAHGNAISFLIEYDRLSFIEAVETLANAAGLTLPVNADQSGQHKNLSDHYELLTKVSTYYQQQLRHHAEAKQAVAYLKARGVDGRTAKLFAIGYAPAGWHNLTTHFGNSRTIQQQLTATGMLTEKNQNAYDRFRQRIMFPIRDPRGRVIGFGGRTLNDDTPKYLNSPETAIYHKSKALYGLYELLQKNRQVNEIIIVEGYLDVIALAQHGITNVVATLGTATTKEHLQLLFRYSQQLIFCFDGDAAGKQAAWRALQTSLPLLQDGVNIRFLFLPEGEDPDSMVRQQGAQALQQQLQQASSLADFMFKELCADLDIADPAGKAKLKHAASPLLKQVPAGVFKQLLIERLAKLIRIDSNKLDHMLDDKAALSVGVATARGKQLDKPMTPLRLALSLLLQYPQLAASIHDQQPQINAISLPGIEYLQQVLQILAQNPQLTTGALLEYWRDQPIHPHLVKLATWQHPVPETGLEAELHGSLKRLLHQQQDYEMERLLTKATLQGLVADEKKLLQDLIKRQKQLQLSKNNLGGDISEAS